MYQKGEMGSTFAKPAQTELTVRNINISKSPKVELLLQ